MSNQLSFLKGISIICLSIFILFFNCNSDVDIQNEEMHPLTDVLTLELTFGADEDRLPGEYLIALPMRIIVPDNGDIIVSDERRLKVYDSDGNPEKIIGRPGQGPGEFSGGYAYSYITETGYISAKADLTHLRYNIFAPDYSFVELKNFRYSDVNEKLTEEIDWMSIRYYDAYCYSPEEFLFRISAKGKSGENILKTDDTKKQIAIMEEETERTINTLVYQNGDTIENICTTVFLPSGKGNISPERGYFHNAPLNDRRIVYTYAPVHKIFEDGRWYYSLFVHNLKTLEKVEIKTPYTPVIIPDSVIYKVDESAQWIIDGSNSELSKRTLERVKDRTKRLEELKYYSAVKDLFTDGDVIFVFTYEFNENNEQVVDVIDSRTRERLSSAYFPFTPIIIKNGFTYRIAKNEEGFYVIEKYRIDPAVYGK